MPSTVPAGSRPWDATRREPTRSSTAPNPNRLHPFGRRQPAGARLSVVVDSRWRADALHEAFLERAVAEPVEPVGAAATGYVARTAFARVLAPAAARWTRGPRQGTPPDLDLSAGALRLWALAAGHADDAGFLLLTGASAMHADDPLHQVAGAQLARAGVAAVSLSRGSARSRPGWRVTSARRVRRLAELVGPPPAGCGPDWPVAGNAPGRTPAS